MLSKQQVESIKWYRQSGAGIMLCLGMPWLAIAENMYKKSSFHFPNDMGTCLKTESGYNLYHYFDYFLTIKEVEKIFEHLKNNDGLFEKLKADFYPAAKEMEKVGLAILDKRVDSPEFADGYKKFFELSMEFWGDSLFIDLLDPFESKVIDFIFATSKKDIEKGDLNILLSPDEISLFRQNQQQLLDIYKVAQEKGADAREVRDLIKAHSDNYYWLKNDYEKVEYLDEAYFAAELQTLLSDETEVQNILNGLKKFEETKANKLALITKYQLSEESIRLLNFFNWVTTFRDDRKKYNQIGNYILTRTIEKISSELGIDLELLKYAVPDELPLIIKGDKDILAELNQRLNIGFIIFADKTEKLEVISGPEGKEYFDILEKTITASEIRGSTASPGKAIGTVKIVLNQSDFSKVENGDIIVASMTRPEYVSIMKKASAIVTDEGGITCHAAIVSRELDIPCITGTQVATRLLKDGDLIDVNANHGFVKIIKNA